MRSNASKIWSFMSMYHVWLIQLPLIAVTNTFTITQAPVSYFFNLFPKLSFPSVHINRLLFSLLSGICYVSLCSLTKIDWLAGWCFLNAFLGIYFSVLLWFLISMILSISKIYYILLIRISYFLYTVFGLYKYMYFYMKTPFRQALYFNINFLKV